MNPAKGTKSLWIPFFRLRAGEEDKEILYDAHGTAMPERAEPIGEPQLAVLSNGGK